MPQLSDLAEKRLKKKFIKRNYRPWDLSGTDNNILSDSTHTISLTEADDPMLHPRMRIFENEVKKINNLSPISYKPNLGNDKGNKKITIKATKRQHIDNKQVTIREHLGNIKVTTKEQKDNDLGNAISNDLEPDFYIEMIRKLSGIQEKIFHHVVELCSGRAELNTGHLLTTDLAVIANCSVGSAKTSLNRLIEKKLILRDSGKRARGGHLFLRVKKEILTASAQARKHLQHIQYGLLGNISDNNIGNNQPNSSSNNIYNTTTSTLPTDWQEIDYGTLSSIGFSITQLTQLYSKQLNVPQIIQESINHFAYGLEHNPKFKNYSDPLNVFMGVLRKGGAWYEKNYVSPKEKALEKLLKIKKEEAERVEALEKNLLKEKYRIWLASLSDNEKNNILRKMPNNDFLPKGMAEKAAEGHFLQYFKDNVREKNNETV
ncbi:MAG: hypothetical protein K0R24_817 [Gammaproteobacteria bacterium]|jgi:hypothetical protein|nr:hypothetical protein [Gammaproteobacteria bacterium]